MGEIRKRCDDAPQSKSTSCEISESLFAQLSERALPARRVRASLRRFSCGCRYHSTQWISFLSEIPRWSCACATNLRMRLKKHWTKYFGYFSCFNARRFRA